MMGPTFQFLEEVDNELSNKAADFDEALWILTCFIFDGIEHLILDYSFHSQR